MTDLLSKERLDELYGSYAEDRRIQEQFGDGDYANESGDIMKIISEVKSLRTQLAELREQEPVEYKVVDPFGEITLRREKCEAAMYSEMDTWSVTPLYARPAPPAVSQSINAEIYELVAQAWKLIPQSDDLATAAWHSAASVFLRDYPRNLTCKSYMVPDEMTASDEMTVTAQMFAKGHNACRAAMLHIHSGDYNNMVAGVAVTAEHQRVIGLLLGVCGAAFELADDSCECEMDGEQCVVVPCDSFERLSDALDEIENTLPDQYDDLPSTVLQWAAVPRHALRALLQLSGNSQSEIDYKGIVERISEIVHGKVTDIDLLTITVKSMAERLKDDFPATLEGCRTTRNNA
ncbi:hypothetical protein CUU54_01260 [Pectobacterium polaris]|uniref:hypothetical protein n=1 Tax=Pectobacterium polaris TaxID=2042057 RepID=UPI000D621E40|nr:hypothetical protein [Pectobacterium polaris]MCU1787485.1 hypothetical protein [Pectobacterium polaris]PWD59559.1 hypothetical protein DF209_10090 [Pectobacterium polaris]